MVVRHPVLFRHKIKSLNRFRIWLKVNNTGMTTLIIDADAKKMKALKSILKALDISFEIKKEESYDAAFVAKIKESEEDVKAGRTRKIILDEIWK